AGTPVKCPRCGVVFTAPATASPIPSTSVPPDQQIQQPGRAPQPPAWSSQPSYGHASQGYYGQPYGTSPRERPDELPGKIRATFAMVLLGVTILTDLMGIGTAALEYNLNAKVARNAATDAEIETVEMISGCSGLLQMAVLIGTAVAFCMWIYKAHENLRLL